MKSRNTDITHPLLDQISNAVVCLYFFCMPWGVYNALPISHDVILSNLPFFFMFRSITTICTIMFIVMAILRLFKMRKWPIPLELTWTLIALCFSILFGRFYFISIFFSENTFSYITGHIIFTTLLVALCTTHWTTIRNALWLHAFSGALVCILSILAHFRYVIPTIWPSAESPYVMAFAHNSTYGITVFFQCLLAGWLLALTRISPLWMRLSAGLFASIISCLFIYYLINIPIALNSLSVYSLILKVILFLTYWLVARTIAKAWLRSLELSRSDVNDKKHSGMLKGVSIVLLISLFSAEFLAIIYANGFMLPILFAYVILVDTPRQLRTTPPRAYLSFVLIPLVSLLLIYNVFNVTPNMGDPRDYQRNKVINYQDYKGINVLSSYPYIRAQLQSINQLYPDERNTWYWIAQSRLVNGDADGSVEYYLKSLEPGNPIIIKDYPQEIKDKYLQDLRKPPSYPENQETVYDDRLTEGLNKPNTTPPLEQKKTGLPYERVLLGTGDTAAAMTLLQAKADTQPAATPPYSREAMLWGLGRILERGETKTLFSDWLDEKLCALLRQQAISEGSAESNSVLSLLVQEDRVTFELWQNGRAMGGCFRTPSDLWFKEKAIKKLTSESITIANGTITTPLFTITLGDTPSIEINPKALPPGKVASGMQQPFTHRFILFAP